jgi:hypothetical protein
MTKVLLAGIGAGIAAALLYLAPIGGTFLAFPLFLLTGLPIGIAGLGWGVVAGAVAVLAGAVVVFFAVAGLAAAIFLLLFGAPALWLSRLALMSRPADTSSPDGPRQWYPLGRLLMHAAGAAAIGLVLAGALIGFDPQALTREIAGALADVLARLPAVGAPPTVADVTPYVRFNVAIMPVTVAVLLVAVLVFDLWLAAVIARVSGRLVRPASPLWTAALPNQALIPLAIALPLILLPGIPAEMGKVLVGTFGGAAALTGLAVLHALTRGMAGRVLLLSITYVLVVVTGLPLILLAILGVAEASLHLRARRFAAAPPD